MDGPALGGILTLLHGCLDIKGTVLDKYHYLLFYLAPAMNPRYLCLIDPEEGKLVKATARVGIAVETVGQAGRPKTITGFQVPYAASLCLCLLRWFLSV
jgi:26S proteasome regulatory subunit N1